MIASCHPTAYLAFVCAADFFIILSHLDARSCSPLPPSRRSIFRARWSLYLATRCFCLIPRRSLADSLVAAACLPANPPPPSGKGESLARIVNGECRRGAPVAPLPVVARLIRLEPFAAAAAAEWLKKGRDSDRFLRSVHASNSPRQDRTGRTIPFDST